MEKFEMSLNTKLEVALEIISAKIGKMSTKGYSTASQEMQTLLKERDEMYSENMQVIERIINEYGPEIKKELQGE